MAMIFNTRAFGALLFALMSAAGAAGAHDLAKPADKQSGRISIAGNVEQALSFDAAALRQIPEQHTLTLARPAKDTRPAKTESFKGVLLADLLKKAGMVARDHNDLKKTVIIAGATDGYKVVFSWGELLNSPVGEGVLVFFEKDGAPLGDAEGPIALISTKDIRPGPRHVRWLKDIEVRKVVE